MNLFSSLFRRSEKHRTHVDLRHLDDHLLRDIGLTRADIHRMMNGSRTAHAKAPRIHE